MQEASREFFISGGTLPLESESYVERSADVELFRHLSAARYCYVLNSRQMGKSSLSVRTIAKLNERGIQTAFVDLTRIGQNVQADQWYAGLAGEVGRAFGLTSAFLKYYKAKAELSPMQRFFGTLRDVLLEQVSDPIVIFIDEIDGTRNLPFDTDEFYAGIRECFNRRVYEEIYNRLTFCLIGVAVPNDLIRNPTITPFNIGERIRLQDFELDEIQQLGKALGPSGERLARRIHYWTNGQPFLTQSLCREIAGDTRIQEERDVDALVQRLYFGPMALETNLNLSDVANRVLWDSEPTTDPDKYRANLLSAYERTWKGGSIADDEANRVAVILKLSGLLRPLGARLVTRNRIYHHVFNRAWIEANMPGQELIRQVHSFRRGLIRGISLTALIGAVIGGLALVALRERQAAIDAKSAVIAAKSALEYELYVSQMNSLRLLEGTGDRAGMAAVLERSRTNQNRGFEWNFWMGRLHDGTEEYTMDYSAPGKDETGMVSPDGRQICVVDKLLGAAAIVDRLTKRTLATPDIGQSYLIASTRGFLSVQVTDGLAQVNLPQPVTDVVTGKVLTKIGTPGYVLAALGSRDRTDIVVLQEKNGKNVKDEFFSSWNLLDGRCLFRVRRPPESINMGDPDVLSTIASKDGRRFVYRMHTDATPAEPHALEHLIVWDCSTNREVDDVAFRSNPNELAFSESGKLLAYQVEQRIMKIRDVEHRRDLYSLDTGIDTPIAVAISPDDRTIACITSNGLATFREIPSGRLLAVRSNLRSISPSGQNSLWVGCSSSVRLLSIPLRDSMQLGPRQTVAADGEGALRIYTQGHTSLERLSDPGLQPMPSLPLPKQAKSLTYNRLWCLTPEPDGTERLNSIGGTTRSVHIPVNAKNLACGIHSDIFAVLSNTGKWSGISGGTGKVIWTNPNVGEYTGMWLTKDSTHLIGCTETGYIASLDPLTGRELRRSRAHHLFFSSLSFSRDGKQIVTGGGDGLAVLWDTETLDKLQEFRGNAGSAVQGADISPDGSRVATCTGSGDWHVWDSKTGVELTKIRGSSYALRSIKFTADGLKLVTSGDDGVFRTWAGLDHDPTIKVPVPVKNLKDIGFK